MRIKNDENFAMKTEEAIFGGGCFWCLETIFSQIKGVESVESGYSGGEIETPSYEEVGSGATGHAEVVRIVYNPRIINYENLVYIYFSAHDPTTLNRQGNDVGSQYRSVIFYVNDDQEKIAKEVKNELEKEKVYENKIVTEIEPLKSFYPAENYHQKYYQNNYGNAYCQFVISPKLLKFRKKFKKYLKKEDSNLQKDE